jgi:SAM-dependent methyltransferase
MSSLRTDDLYTSGAYLDANPEWHAGESPWKAEAIIAMLRKHSIVPASILDIGCGVGIVLQLLAEEYQSAACEGYDISPIAIEMAQRSEAPRLRFRVGMPEPAAHYDLQLALDVAEHVEDAQGWLRSRLGQSNYTVFHLPLDLTVHRVLRPKALLDIRRRYGHLHFFNRDLALEAVRAAGFEVIDWAYTEEFRLGKPDTLGGRILRPLRSALYRLNPDHSVRLVGGCRLLILARDLSLEKSQTA